MLNRRLGVAADDGALPRERHRPRRLAARSADPNPRVHSAASINPANCINFYIYGIAQVDAVRPGAGIKWRAVSEADEEKRIAAEAAAELVEDGMTVGLGTGSTVAYPPARDRGSGPERDPLRRDLGRDRAAGARARHPGRGVQPS